MSENDGKFLEKPKNFRRKKFCKNLLFFKKNY